MEQKTNCEHSSQESTQLPAGIAISPDDRAVFDAWRAGGADAELAYTATQQVREMAAVNLVTLVEARLRVFSADLKAELSRRIASVETKVSELQGEVKILRNDLQGEINKLRNDLQGEMIKLRSDLHGEMAELRSDLHGEMAELRSVLHGEITSLRSELQVQEEHNKARYHGLVSEIRSLRWMMVLLITMFGAVLAVLVQGYRGGLVAPASETGNTAPAPAAFEERSAADSYSPPPVPGQ